MEEIYKQFLTGLKNTGFIEYIAVISGIVSVWFSRKENILTYPIGLLNTVLYIYLSLKGGLLGEASVNFYYTVMSIWGWYLWSKKDKTKHPLIYIAFSSGKERLRQVFVFLIFYFLLFFSISWMKNNDYLPGAIPWADAFASATAYTAMWLMNKKKVESWYWWIATNMISIPLYFVKEYVFTSVYYTILLVFAFWGLSAWIKKARHQHL